MKRSVSVSVVAVIAVVAVLAGVTALRRLVKGRAIEETAPVSGHMNVGVEEARVRDIVRAVYATGEVESPCVVELVPKVGGVLEGYTRADGSLLKEGDSVEAGGQVAVIEHAALDAVVRQAAAALKVAEAAVRQAQIGRDRTKKDGERIENLFNQGSVNEQQRDQAVAGAEAADAALGMAKAQMEAAQAALNLAEINMKEAFLVSPVAGVLVRKYVDPGNLVGPGRPVLRIAVMDPVRVSAEIGERNLGSLAGGSVPAEITVDAIPGRIFAGAAVLKRPDVNRMSRTISVEMELPNPGGLLKPGMFARVRLVLDEKKGVLAAPESAIVRNGGECVFVVEGGKAVRREVKLGLSDGLVSEILSGIQPGEKIVISGAQAISDGEAVTVTLGGGE